jgi:hypothetical protein
MAKVLSTCDLIETALRRAMIPSDQATFTDCDIIDMMNEELGIHMMPLVMRAHEEYYVVDEDVQMENKRSVYKIPYRSIGNKLRDIQFVDAGGSMYEMTRTSIEHRPDYQGNYSANQPRGYYVQSDNVVLLQNTASTGALRMSYYLRPNNLVKSDCEGKIAQIDTCACTGTTTFTLEEFPSKFNTGIEYDFIQYRSPNKVLGFDFSPVSICTTAKTITFNTDDLVVIDPFDNGTLAITFTVGDYVMKAEETPVPQLPTELHPILAQRTAVKMLEALGDMEGMKAAQNELERMEYNAMTLIDNRVEGSPQKVNNRHGFLKQTVFSNVNKSRLF